MCKIVKHTLFLFACFLIGINHVDAQNKQNNQWRFGFGSSIDFNTTPPSYPSGAALPSILPPLITGTQIEGTAVIADKSTGALLFYTDGITIWNALNQPMPNGTNLGGSDALSSYMAAVIVPMPGSCSKYYIFCQDDYEYGCDGITYSVVDMGLDNGLGDVVAGQKSIPLYDNETEVLMAYPKSSGDGYWLITNGPDLNNTTLVSFDVSSQGINTTPVSSSIVNNGSGRLNYQGNKFVCSGPYDNIANNFLGFEIYNFNAATGQLGSSVNIPFIPTNGDLLQYFEFTFNGNYLYAAGNYSLFRFDLTSGNPTTIAATGTLISFTNSNGPNGVLQQGPDSSLYHVIGNRVYQIENPDDLIPGPITQLPSVVMPFYSLPPWIFLNPNNNPQGIITSSSDLCIPTNQTFTVSDTLLINSILWNFDDPNSGLNNSSALISPSHQFTSAGQYTISAIVNYACGVDTILFPIQINALPLLTLSTVSGTCGQANGTATVNATGGAGNFTYTWSNGATGNFISGLSSGSYSVVATDQNGCTSTSQVIVSTTPAAGINLTASDTILGLNETAVLEIIGGDTYNWTPSTGLSCDDCPSVVASPSSSTTYTVTGTDTSGCPYLRVINVLVDIVCNELFVPNIFSPNGIGNVENEKLCLYSNCIKSMNLGIYNRWGELIYATDNQAACWDGTYKGEPAMTGVYSYRLFVEQFDGEKIEKTGNILLTR
jgi:gliding motility-associated-like protein